MHRLIAHSLIKKDGKILVIKRSKIKRGKPNMYPEYWDIPGGTVEENECPQNAAIREACEEVNQHIKITHIIHEDSNFDAEKRSVFTRLVYVSTVFEWLPIILDPEEHTTYRFIETLDDLAGEMVVPYLVDIMGKDIK